MEHVTKLGRSVVIAAAAKEPVPWSGAPHFVVDPVALDDRERLEQLVAGLHRAWVNRRPLVIDLRVDPAAIRRPETTTMDPWRLRRGFLFNRERLHHLIWANSYDNRNDELIWWWGHKAAALGATAGGSRDVVLPDGTHVWIDGGPRGPIPGLSNRWFTPNRWPAGVSPSRHSGW